ncbi:MAG: TonB-dependent receptor [Polaribacter sp.]|uniref:SusC/RagA family TonB-linked outer membrane protein n=1 Tax=Polaribacter sp. TaxID=1920175 RepID=UPI003BB12893
MKVLILNFLLLLSLGSIAQNTIKGTVSDPNGNLLPGASLTVKGSTRGITTDFDGAFTLVASVGETIEVSYLGYESLSFKVDSKKTYAIVLQESANQLDEIVVVGYGTQKKVNLTGSVQTVTFKDEVNQPVTNSGQLMYGRFSGVQLSQTSGSPGADGSSIQIRGIGTFGSTTPLIVIDNIQYEGLGAFNALAPSDIESISVLKDASSLAIYGARAANGVVLVTTRKGKADKFEVSFNSFYGIQQATIKPEFLGSLDYANLMNEKFRNQNGVNFDPRYTPAQIDAIATGSLPDQFANTNWANEVLTLAPLQNHNLSISGGNNKTTYRLSLGFLNQEAIVRSKFSTERYNMSLNINSDAKDWLKISSVTNAFWRINKGPAGGQDAFDGDNGIIYSFQRAAPTIPLFYSNGQYGFVDGAYLNTNASLGTQNPLRRGYFGNYESNQVNISTRLGLTFKITDNVTFETSGSANLVYTDESNFSPRNTQKDWDGNIIIQNDLNSLSNSSNFSRTLLNENIIRFSKTFNQVHQFDALVGHSIYYFKTDGFNGSLSGFPTDNIEEFSGGGIVEPSVGGGAAEDVKQSFFGRLKYNYDEKYLAEINFRYDASGSAFGPDNLYGAFPSASLGWKISKENFMKDVEVINDLKLRVSYGLVGNDKGAGRYVYEQTYNPGLDYVLGNDVIVGGVAITSLANPFIRWEQSELLDFGIDFGMLRNKLQIEVGYFRKNSTDILYANFPVPATVGVTNIGAKNSASMVSEGIEFNGSYRGNIGGLKYNVGGNFTTFFRNEVTSLGEGGEETITASNILRIGEPFRAYFGYQAIGIFQSINEIANAPTQFGNTATGPGDIRYADANGDGVVNQDDRVVIGNPNPDLLYNFNASFEYNNFDFNFLFQGVYGVDRLIQGNGNLPMVDDRSNVLTYWLNRWTPQNPSTSLPRVGGQNNQIVSDFYVQDASYLRLKNLEIGYSLPSDVLKKMNLSKLRLFVGAQNLLTFTGLENFDPERGSGTQSNRAAPLYRTITLGINLKL